MTTASFGYRAARPDGSIVRGRVEAPDPREVKRRLEGDGLAVLHVSPARSRPDWRPVRRRDLAVVFRNVAILIGDGVPVERAFASSQALVRGRLADAIDRLRGAVREGQSVGDAMAAAGDVFPRSLVGIMKAGEHGSQLTLACETVAEQLDADVRLRSELWGALTYPALVLIVGLVSIIVMGAVVVPRFADVVSGLGGELPATTRALLAGSVMLRDFGPMLGIGLAAVTLLVLRALRSVRMRARLDRVLLRLPVVGGLRLGFATARTCRALGGMLSTGMPLLIALDAAAEATGDLEVSRRLSLAREKVVRGGRLTDALTDERALAPFALQLVGVGESGGQLGPMTARAGDIVAERTQTALRALVSLVEPMLIVVLGCLIAGVSAALLQAVYSVRP